MNTMICHRHTLGIVGLAVLSLSLSTAAQAADFGQRKESERRSAEVGIGRSEVPLLERLPGRGREAVADEVLRRFARADSPITTREEHSRETHNDRLGVVGEGWFLHIAGDGTAVSYRNYGLLDRQLELARPVAERFGQEELEEMGRQFIANELEGLVELGPGEEVVPLYTEFQIAGGGPAKEGAPPDPEQVVASAVVFSRSIDGLPVVGAGSKIAVIFANDGSPVGFELDWPRYRTTGRSQKVLPLPAIRERSRKLGTLDPNSPEVTVSRFDCGYFDPGARRRDPKAVVQSACFVQASSSKIVDRSEAGRDPDSGRTFYAVAEAIPAGREVEPDRRWPQAEMLRGYEPRERQGSPGAGPDDREASKDTPDLDR